MIKSVDEKLTFCETAKTGNSECIAEYERLMRIPTRDDGRNPPERAKTCRPDLTRAIWSIHLCKLSRRQKKVTTALQTEGWKNARCYAGCEFRERDSSSDMKSNV